MLSPIFSSTGSAQIVDVQSRLSGAPAEGIRGETALSGEWRTGNTDSFTFAADLSIERTRGRNQSFLIVASELGRASGASYANRHFAHLRHRFHLGERWAVEGFLQSEFDEFKRLELRALAGVGVRAVVAKSRGAGRCSSYGRTGRDRLRWRALGRRSSSPNAKAFVLREWIDPASAGLECIDNILRSARARRYRRSAAFEPHFDHGATGRSRRP